LPCTLTLPSSLPSADPPMLPAHRPGGDPRRRGHAAAHALRHAFGHEAADRHLSLADRVDLAVGAVERRHQQRAALERFGVTERAHGDV
jgi:hypothetical protein